MKRDKLSNKVAVITGAGGGIGKEIAKLLDKNHVKLVLSDINGDKLQELSDQLNQEPLIIPCDITILHDVQKLVSTTLDALGTIDILINTVGIIIPSLFEETSHEAITKQINVNLIGSIYCIKEVIPTMTNGGGNIVILSSLAGIVPETHSSIYTATKFALRGLNFTLNLELKSQGIIVSTIFPDSVDTPMLEFEAKFGGSPLTFLDDPIPPSDVAKAVVKAILKDKVEICVPKSRGRVSKLIMCFPKLVQRIWPKLEEKGEKKKQEYLTRLNEPKK